LNNTVRTGTHLAVLEQDIHDATALADDGALSMIAVEVEEGTGNW
jgi:hypothetical protein